MTGGVSETDFTHQLQSVRRTSYTLTAEDANQTVDEYIAGHTIGQGKFGYTSMTGGSGTGYTSPEVRNLRTQTPGIQEVYRLYRLDKHRRR